MSRSLIDEPRRRAYVPFVTETAATTETVSNVTNYPRRVLRASLCVIYGRLGLPVPFRVGLTYVVGKAIYPRGTVEEVRRG